MRRLGWRLGETFVAVAVSKFAIVITLVLGLNELTGSSATAVITGAVTLLLATATPYLVLRVVPFLEQSALHQFDGLRSRATRAAATTTSVAGRAAGAMTPERARPVPANAAGRLGSRNLAGIGESPMPPLNPDTPAPPPPIGKPRLRGGHVAYGRDDVGPVVGWHFDE